MSNPVTNADIEDVLSSIRRLVSEETRAEITAPTAQPSDRLVLTPALRVMETEQPEEILSGHFEPQETPDDPVTDELPSPEWVEAHEMAEADLDETGRLNLEARIAELEAVIADTGGQWEQDGELGSANAGGPVEALDWEGEAEGEPELAHSEADPAEMSEPVSEWEEAPFHENAEAETNEALHTAEPISLHEDDPQEILQDQIDTDEAPYAPQEDIPRDFLVDEEMLRGLVAEIVRQELQGPLGERITRNVRKLVRREIMRALASQDLE